MTNVSKMEPQLSCEDYEKFFNSIEANFTTRTLLQEFLAKKKYIISMCKKGERLSNTHVSTGAVLEKGAKNKANGQNIVVNKEVKLEHPPEAEETGRKVEDSMDGQIAIEIPILEREVDNGVQGILQRRVQKTKSEAVRLEIEERTIRLQKDNERKASQIRTENNRLVELDRLLSEKKQGHQNKVANHTPISKRLHFSGLLRNRAAMLVKKRDGNRKDAENAELARQKQLATYKARNNEEERKNRPPFKDIQRKATQTKKNQEAADMIHREEEGLADEKAKQAVHETKENRETADDRGQTTNENCPLLYKALIEPMSQSTVGSSKSTAPPPAYNDERIRTDLFPIPKTLRFTRVPELPHKNSCEYSNFRVVIPEGKTIDFWQWNKADLRNWGRLILTDEMMPDMQKLYDQQFDGSMLYDLFNKDAKLELPKISAGTFFKIRNYAAVVVDAYNEIKYNHEMALFEILMARK